MKLCQGQLWKKDNVYIRIVRLERLAVDYRSMSDPASKESTPHHATKKEFCRLLKGAQLLDGRLPCIVARKPIPGNPHSS